MTKDRHEDSAEWWRKVGRHTCSAVFLRLRYEIIATAAYAARS